MFIRYIILWNCTHQSECKCKEIKERKTVEPKDDNAEQITCTHKASPNSSAILLHVCRQFCSTAIPDCPNFNLNIQISNLAYVSN